MNRILKFSLYSGLLGVAAIGAVGCKSSSHTSVQTYEYGPAEERRNSNNSNWSAQNDQAVSQPTQDELTEDYQMVSPGTMIVEP